ncbi:tRNA pseudouridine(38-40) synthase TruA [Konateibacter massiliensis]|uniref:tRNA pseudouridine(38-40) synthase TruA n=1 Tax=Konateibacter massiliensis TaxID=2002841 RepID=UPI000C15733E|nr:tRNA pseudouridine(38-40) synthase TruA [Konateibacter massiliensis]
MKRVKMIVAYEGTNYCGFQVQPNGITIEEVLNKKLTELLNENIKVIGASRTDSGVHALGNVVVFDSSTRIPGEKISFALNCMLPEDIRIQGSCEVASDFHPRYCKTRKTYEYRIVNRTFPIPTLRNLTHFEHYPMDVERMREAAKYLVGEHDFKSFATAKLQVESTVREIYSLTVEEEGEMIVIRVTGNGFLYNMVRIISGTLMEIGKKQLDASIVSSILEGCDRSLAGPTAPAKGLTLVEIEYL